MKEGSKPRNLMIGVKPDVKQRFKTFKKNNETDSALLTKLMDAYEKNMKAQETPTQ